MHVDATTIVAGVGILSSFVLGYLGWKDAHKKDTATQSNTAVEQVINGLNDLVNNLQGDNKTLRIQVKELGDALQTVTKERDQLREEVRQLHAQYGTSS